jgi:sugar lactone lactonase YvrE
MLYPAPSFAHPSSLALTPSQPAQLEAGTLPLRTRHAFARVVATLCLALACLCAASPASAQTAAYFGQPLGGGYGNPVSVAMDSSGNVYVADLSNSAVKKVALGCTSSSCVTTVGSGFTYPSGVAVDSSGNVYVTDYGTGGEVKELPLSCIQGANNSSCIVKLGGGFAYPRGVAVDSSGNVYVADTNHNAVKEIPLTCIQGVNNSSCVTTLGGGFNTPNGVAVDASGNVYVADTDNNAVDEMPAGCANSSCVTPLGGGFFIPEGVAVDASGNIYVANAGNGSVLEMPAGCASSSCVTSLAGGSSQPFGVAVGASGNIAVADSEGLRVTEIVRHAVSLATTNVTSSSTQTLTFTIDTAGTLGVPAVLTQGTTGKDFTDAGTGTCTTNGTSYSYAANATCTVNVKFAPLYSGTRYGAAELLDGSGNVIATAHLQSIGTAPQITFGPSATSTLAGAFYPSGVAVDPAGDLYFTELFSNVVTEMPVGCGSSSCAISLGGGFSIPYAVVVDGAGNLYVADEGNAAVKQIPPGCASSSCVVTLGGGFNEPESVAVDASGNVYVSDFGNGTVSEMPPGCASSTCVTQLGGGFSYPTGVAVDPTGNVYVSDDGHSAVDEIPVGCTSSACVITLGGGFEFPTGIAVGGTGNLYVSDAGANVVYQMPANCASSACVSPLGGGFNSPSGLAVDGSGNVFVADQYNNAVDEINLATPPSLTFASTNVGSISSDSPQTVTLTNIGNAPLTFPVTGSANPSISANFTFASGTTCPLLSGSSSAPDSLPAAATCSLAINFAPLSGGSIGGSVVLTDNNLNTSNGIQSVNLSGTGVSGPPLPQPISFHPFGAVTYSPGLTIPLAATGGASGNPVTFSVVSGPGTVSGTTLTVTGAGTILIAANQLGNAFYLAAPQAVLPLTVRAASQPIDFNPLGAVNYAPGLTIPLAATGGASGNPVTFSVVSGPGTVSGTTLTVTGAGTILIAANQLGNANYLAAPQAVLPLTVHAASQPLSFHPLAAVNYSPGLTVPLAATGGGSGNPVTFSVVSGPGTVSGTTLTVTAPGTIVIAANQLGNANYLAAPQAVLSLTVNGPR